MNNIFNGTGDTVQLINLIDKLLRRDGYITYDDIIKEYSPEYVGVKREKNPKVSSIKKAINTMKKKLNEMGTGFEYSNGKDARNGFRYPQDNPDPFKSLREGEKKQLTKQLLRDYCKATRFMIPQVFAEKKVPSLLLDDKPSHIIESDSNPLLCNIDLLPVFFEYIEKKKVVSFIYNARYVTEQKIIFHPHFLKEYNNRWFIWGCLEKEDGIIVEAYNYSIDRIVPKSLKVLEDKKFVYQAPSFYLNLLKNVVGVTIPKNKEPEKIIIETLDEKVHGLMNSKPIHCSQTEIQKYVDGKQTGKFELYLIPNIEFFGNVLHYGESIRIIEPLSIKDEIKKKIEKMLEAYI